MLSKAKIKFIIPVVIIAIVAAFGLCACSQDEEKAPDLPGADVISRVEFEHVNGGALSTVIKLDDSKIATLVSDIKDKSSYTDKESTNDEPNGVDYVRATLYRNDGSEDIELYFYEKDGKTYVEQPYEGIWEIPKDVFTSVNENKDKVVIKYKD